MFHIPYSIKYTTLVVYRIRCKGFLSNQSSSVVSWRQLHSSSSYTLAVRVSVFVEVSRLASSYAIYVLTSQFILILAYMGVWKNLDLLLNMVFPIDRKIKLVFSYQIKVRPTE